MRLSVGRLSRAERHGVDALITLCDTWRCSPCSGEERRAVTRDGLPLRHERGAVAGVSRVRLLQQPFAGLASCQYLMSVVSCACLCAHCR